MKLYVIFGLHIHFSERESMNSDHQRVKNIFTRLKCFFQTWGVIFIEYLQYVDVGIKNLICSFILFTTGKVGNPHYTE